MDHLIDYDSSSLSSSESSTSVRLTARPSPNQQVGIVSNVDVLTCNEQNAILQDSSNDTGRVGNDCHCKEGTPNFDGERNASANLNEVNAAENSERMSKRQKLNNLSIPRVIIAGDDKCKHDSYMFERGNSHWEGRWAGHLFLPFPPMNQLDAVDRNANEDSDSSDSSHIEEDSIFPELHEFLPTVRILIKYWAVLLQERFHSVNQSNRNGNNDTHEKESTPIVIIPHIPMDAASKSDEQCLHVSLSRPIYLPTPSVDSFISSISNSIKSITSASNLGINSNRNGKIFHLEPRKAVIFTNELQNRSFLTIPLSGQNAQWVKHALLPSIDATMKKFGLESYYSEEGENCILHVSVASVKGNMVKAMASERNRSTIRADVLDDTRSIPMFQNNSSFDSALSQMKSSLETIPSIIPICLDRVQCQFGKVKERSIQF